MSLAGLLPYLSAAKPIEELIDAVNNAHRTGQVLGVLPAAVPAVAAALQRAIERPVLIIAGREDAAYRFYEQMLIYSERPDRILFYPAHDALAYERLAADVEKAGQRLQALAALCGKDAACNVDIADYRPPIVIASAKSITQLTMSREDLLSHIDRICLGERFPVTKAVTRWVEMGYEPVVQVEDQGTFARRGGIVDIFPTGSNQPVRIDFFGDEVDSIRFFDPATQRSGQKLAHIAVPPATEAPLWRSAEAYERLTRIDCSVCRPEVREEWENILSDISLGSKFEGVESFLEAYAGRPYSIMDHLPDDALTVIISPDQVNLALGDIERQAQELRKEFEQQGEIPPDFPLSYLPPSEVMKRLRAERLLSFGESAKLPEPEWSRNLNLFEAPGAYAGQLKRLVGDVRMGLKESQTYVIASPQSERLRDIFEERDIFAVVYKRQTGGVAQPVATGALSIFHDDLALGWKSEQLGVAVFTDAEVFGWTRPVKRVTRAQRTAVEAFETDLQPGDHVVHIQHGIARYDGLIKMETNGEEREYLLLQYAGADRLYVPVDQLDRLTPYVALGQAEPVLNRLGTVEWTRAKRKVKKAVAELAKELLEIYSAREAGNGHAFAPDGNWQRELEDSFPYVETPDQMRAILDVKADMEQTKPMDRLVCGDVGYGKTEVAVRAAFKAVADGKQVAILVPTTVLAQQHFNTFSQRLAPFPVRVEVLSRFRSRKEQKAVIEDLEKGQVDVIIGTHRLLQKDVKLKDLGLIIVDEEQRFGVRHKETLKKLRKEVDVLTMTATPIPRTLHMALSGVRDMSVIETPPEQRLPIKTYVTAYGDSLVREVILREMSRGGQVYYVHNRVQSMPHVLRRLTEIVPEARVVVGHGQMEEGQLEKVMMAFIAGEYDVLLCTTIIESGLDIPNVNTLIIDDATHFGLAQLYQLRGRVGRSSDRAYAYFLYDQNRPITIPGQQRLETIQEATELGAGFRVAMRDLEIRGAGNLLGPEQSGHVASVGFDLYSRLLAQAVQDYKEGHVPAEEAEEEEAVTLDLPLSAYLPNDYVENDSLRLKLYRDAAKLTTTREINDFRSGLMERFGPIPPEVDNLLYLVRLRNAAQKAKLASISASDGQLVLMLRPQARFSPALMNHVVDLPVTVKSNQIWLKRSGLGPDWREQLYDLVDELAG